MRERASADVEQRRPRVSPGHLVERDLGLERRAEDRAHAGPHHLRVAGVDAVGREQAAEPAEPRQRAQDRAEVAGVLHLVQVDRALARCGRRRGQDGHDRDHALRRAGVAERGHLPGIEGVAGQLRREARGQSALKVFMADEDARRGERGAVRERPAEFQHQVLALCEEMAEFRAAFAVAQTLEVFEPQFRCGRHARACRACVGDAAACSADPSCRSIATASASLMPSTPAERMPPA